MQSGIYLVGRAGAVRPRSAHAASHDPHAPGVAVERGTVPLSQIATIEYGQEYPIVWRRDRRPTVTVQSNVVPGVQATTVVQGLAPKIAALNASLPPGYHVATGGTVEESDKGQTSVLAVGPLMLVLMLTVPMIQLQSFSRLFLMLSVVPLGLIGVVAALLLADKPLGFGDPGCARTLGHDRAKLGNPDRPDRNREGAWPPPLGCGRRSHLSPLPPDPLDCCGCHSRYDPDRANDLLGSDGVRDYARPRGRDTRPSAGVKLPGWMRTDPLNPNGPLWPPKS